VDGIHPGESAMISRLIVDVARVKMSDNIAVNQLMMQSHQSHNEPKRRTRSDVAQKTAKPATRRKASSNPTRILKSDT
jgi:hypothetical protein